MTKTTGHWAITERENDKWTTQAAQLLGIGPLVPYKILIAHFESSLSKELSTYNIGTKGPTVKILFSLGYLFVILELILFCFYPKKFSVRFIFSSNSSF